MNWIRLQHPSGKHLSKCSVHLPHIKFAAGGLLFLLGLVCLLISPESTAASSGLFQESLQTLTLEIRYKNPAAGKVALVWGVNGWQTLPEEDQPAGTELRNGIMSTPMLLEGDSFVIRLQLPAGTSVDYGFLTTQDQYGNPVNIWEANGDKDFQTEITDTDIVVDVQTVLSPGATPISGGTPGGQTASLEIQYNSPTSGEVVLVWGLNGWALAPEGERPAGTVVEENVMHTPMLKEEGSFVTRLQVAPGSVVDFGFLTTKDSQGEAVAVWEAAGADDYHVTVSQDTVQTVTSKMAEKTGRDLPGILVVGVYILIGLVVILVVAYVFRRSPG